MSYHFFAASLPMLGFNAPPPMTVDAFRALCAEAMTGTDYAALAALLDNGETRNGFVLAWRNCDAMIRNAVVRQRAVRTGTAADAAKWTRPQTGIEVFVENAVASAFQEGDPMKRELALAKLRWTKVEDIAGFDNFSVEYLMAYSIKLSILNAIASADAEKGSERLRGLVRTEARPEV